MHADTLPEEWEPYAFFGRIIEAGLCTYHQLFHDGLSWEDIFNMHRFVDLRQYRKIKEQETIMKHHAKMKKAGKHGRT